MMVTFYSIICSKQIVQKPAVRNEHERKWTKTFQTVLFVNACITSVLHTIVSLQGFVCENPTAPVRIIKCRAPPCLNVFCRLGCVCSSLIRKKQITHCAKTDCIFGCSCFRQKVVLLKNLEGPDSSASDDSSSRKRRKRRMRMAYSE